MFIKRILLDTCYYVSADKSCSHRYYVNNGINKSIKAFIVGYFETKHNQKKSEDFFYY